MFSRALRRSPGLRSICRHPVSCVSRHFLSVDAQLASSRISQQRHSKSALLRLFSSNADGKDQAVAVETESEKVPSDDPSSTDTELENFSTDPTINEIINDMFEILLENEDELDGLREGSMGEKVGWYLDEYDSILQSKEGYRALTRLRLKLEAMFPDEEINEKEELIPAESGKLAELGEYLNDKDLVQGILTGNSQVANYEQVMKLMKEIMNTKYTDRFEPATENEALAELRAIIDLRSQSLSGLAGDIMTMGEPDLYATMIEDVEDKSDRLVEDLNMEEQAPFGMLRDPENTESFLDASIDPNTETLLRASPEYFGKTEHVPVTFHEEVDPAPTVRYEASYLGPKEEVDVNRDFKARRPIPSPRDGMTVEKFLTIIKKNCVEHKDVFGSWEDLFTFKTEQLKEKGVPVKQRKWILRWVEKYRQGIEPGSKEGVLYTGVTKY